VGEVFRFGRRGEQERLSLRWMFMGKREPRLVLIQMGGGGCLLVVVLVVVVSQ